MKIYIQNEFAEIWIEEGIIMQYFKPDLEIVNIKAARKIVEDRTKIARGQKWPLFADLNKAISIDKETRDYFASSESIRDIHAAAFLVHNPVTHVGAKLFLSFNKPKVKTEIFNNREKALQWLRKYRHIS